MKNDYVLFNILINLLYVKKMFDQKEYDKKYYIQHKEQIKKRQRKYSIKHKKQIKKYQREWHANNPKYMKEWRINHPDYMKKWRTNHPEYRQSERYIKQLTYKRTTYKRTREEIFSLLGGKCVNPYNLNHGDFINDIRCLQIDHIFGNGYQHRKKYEKIYRYYKTILEEIKAGSKDYQLLCANCNWIKCRKNNEVSYKHPLLLNGEIPKK